jgi:NADPH:quinone reductase-like Zn-dependent oxidoreductase
VAKKVWELSGFGLENLRMVDRDLPEPADHEVLVRVSAVALNLRDKLLVEGQYNPNLEFPMIQGSDAVGVVSSRTPTGTELASRQLIQSANRNPVESNETTNNNKSKSASVSGY